MTKSEMTLMVNNESSDNFDELITDVDWVQCAGLMGSLISQVTDLK